MDWLKKIKVAIVTGKIDDIDKLLQEMPSFDNLEDAKEAMSLLKEANSLLLKEREEVRKNMVNLKRGKKFLESERMKKIHRLLDTKL